MPARARRIVVTAGLVLALPLIIEMDREQQLIEVRPRSADRSIDRRRGRRRAIVPPARVRTHSPTHSPTNARVCARQVENQQLGVLTGGASPSGPDAQQTL